MIVRDKKIFVTFVIVLLLNLFFGSLVYLSFRKIDLEKKAVFGGRKELLANEIRSKDIKTMEIVSEQRKNDCELIDSLFLDEEMIVEFIEELESLAQKSGVFLVMRSVSFPQEDEKLLSLALGVNGSFPGIYKYISLLENDHYWLALDRVYLQKSKIGEGWEASLELRFLNFKNNELQ